MGQGEDFVFCPKGNGEPWEGWEQERDRIFQHPLWKVLKGDISQYKA